MCYTIFLSTTSAEALDALPYELYQFVRTTEKEDQTIGDLIKYPHRWYLTGQYGGCSCHFRHLGEGSDMYFSPPEDWSPEDADDIESTGAVYDALAHIVTSGHRLDLVDMWNGTDPADIRDLPISLSNVSRDAFRFFENHRFIVGS
jgi:hypothetical protein